MQLVTGMLAVALASASAKGPGFLWKSEVPDDCPF
jgi:hypothetical protein